MKRLVGLIMCCLLLVSCGTESVDNGAPKQTTTETKNEKAGIDPRIARAEEVKKIADNFLVSEVTKTDKNGHVSVITKYKYDEKNRVVQETTNSYDSFDSSFNSVSETFYEYNGESDKKARTRTLFTMNNTTNVTVQEYSYSSDDSGNEVLTINGGDTTYKYIFDQNGREIESWWYFEDGGSICNFYFYNEYGELASDITQTKHEDGKTSESRGERTYEYNQDGLKSKMIGGQGSWYNLYEYDENFCLTKISRYESSDKNQEPEYSGCTEYKYISKNDLTSDVKVEEKEETETTEKPEAENVDHSAVLKQFEGINDTWGCFKIYDITDNNEVYFEADWYRLAGFGGVAVLIDDVATFDVPYNDGRLKGTFIIADETIALTVAETVDYIEAGVYEYKFDKKIYTETTCAGMGSLDHSAFLEFLKAQGIETTTDWEYLGSPYEIFILPEYGTAFPFDMYKCISPSGEETYYLCETNSSYKGVYKVHAMGVLQKVWTP